MKLFYDPIRNLSSLSGKAAQSTQPTQAPQETPNGEAQDVTESEDDDDGKEQSKILKQLQFPEIEPSSTFSPDWCPKITKCLQKRVDKLMPYLKTLEEKSDLDRVLTQSSA